MYNSFCNMRSRGAEPEAMNEIRPSSGDTDAGFAMRRYLEALSIAEAPLSLVTQPLDNWEEES